DISMDTDNGLGASAGGYTSDGAGRPIAGSISIERGTDGKGAGWYLDPTPNNSEEIRGDITNAFAGNATPCGDPDAPTDLFTVVALEATHTLGLSRAGDQLFQQDPNGYLTKTTQGDTAFDKGKGTLFTFNGPSVKALFTSNNGGNGGSDTGNALHTAEPGSGNTLPDGTLNYSRSPGPGTAPH